MEVIGIDVGFGFTKATDGHKSVVFKSVLGEAADIQFREQLLDNARAEEHLHLEVDGNAFYAGDLAERQSNTRSFTLDQNQFITGFAKNLALAALSRVTERNVPVGLVTGLPINYYRRHRDDLSTLLRGEHAVTLIDPAGNREETVINVDQVRVVPQPFGSLFGLALSELGEAGDPRFLREKIGIIDIGFRTADYTIADRTRYSERGSHTTESGIAQAFTTIATKLQEKSGVNVELYRLYDAVERGSIKIRGKNFDLKGLTERVFTQLASAIATEVNRLWADDWDIDVMLVTGGGGGVLASYLAPLLNGEVLTAEPAADQRMNNVLGYLRYGRNLWARGTGAPAKE